MIIKKVINKILIGVNYTLSFIYINNIARINIEIFTNLFVNIHLTLTFVLTRAIISCFVII